MNLKRWEYYPVRREDFAKFKLLIAIWVLNCVSCKKGMAWNLNESVNPALWYDYNPVLH